MSIISERIEDLKAQIEIDFGFELETIQTQRALTCYSVEKHKAFDRLENEIISTINGQVLTQWLIDNEIDEDTWEADAYFNDTLYYRGEEVTDE